LRAWAINGDFVTLKPTGVARYAREVTLALDQLVAEGGALTVDLDIELVVPRVPTDLALRHIPVRLVPEFSRPRIPQFWVQFQLPRQVRGGLLSFCNLAPAFKHHHIACIHDLHTKIMPESYGRGFRLAHDVILPLVGRSASRITTVSEFSRGHLIEHGIALGDKVSVTYNGSDHALRWHPGRSTLRLGERSFVFCLGRSQKYKNTELLWKIASALDAMGLDILVGGDIGEVLTAFGPKQPGNIRLLGRISDDDFAFVLSRAVCLLFPSRIEGFGLPAAEAMALGCPLVASTSPCLPEICGDAALFADPDDVRAWVDAVRRLSQEPELRSRLVANGFERAKIYSWRRIAAHYLRLMSEVDAVTPAAGVNRR
jgi:glycosyltransferase involved in cell wall biosynthesis